VLCRCCLRFSFSRGGDYGGVLVEQVQRGARGARGAKVQSAECRVQSAECRVQMQSIRGVRARAGRCMVQAGADVQVVAEVQRYMTGAHVDMHRVLFALVHRCRCWCRCAAGAEVLQIWRGAVQRCTGA